MPLKVEKDLLQVSTGPLEVSNLCTNLYLEKPEIWVQNTSVDFEIGDDFEMWEKRREPREAGFEKRG